MTELPLVNFPSVLEVAATLDHPNIGIGQIPFVPIGQESQYRGRSDPLTPVSHFGTVSDERAKRYFL